MSTPRLAIGTVVALAVGIASVVLCYYFVDRPVAWFMHEHGWVAEGVLKWPPRVSEYLKFTSAIGIVFVFLWRMWRRSGRFQTVLLAISTNVIVTTLIKTVLKWSCGRYWPETWKGENPSLIRTGDYGFHPFQAGVAYEAFPSGHAAVICAAISILWLAYPRTRPYCAVVGGAVCIALVGMNYHFVGDVIAGALLGWLTGVWMTHFFGLNASGPAIGARGDFCVNSPNN